MTSYVTASFSRNTLLRGVSELIIWFVEKWLVQGVEGNSRELF
jgi:hypothetical protein